MNDGVGARAACIFCGNVGSDGKLTGEHIWSDWMKRQRLIHSDPGTKTRETFQRFVGSRSPFGEFTSRYRNGPPNYRKSPVVCGNCNSGWMSVIDNGIIDHLKPLMLSEETAIAPRIRKELAKWIAMKLFVIDATPTSDDPPNPIYSDKHRKRFMSLQEPPKGLLIWLVAGVAPSGGCATNGRPPAFG